jgi:type I restriction enzyme R subunit
MTPATDEKHLRQNAIDLLTRMGYTYISPEEMARYRDSDAQVVLRDLLRERLAALNSYEYKGKTRRFDENTIERAIDDLDESLGEGLMAANQKITDQLVLGNAYAQELPGGERNRIEEQIDDILWELERDYGMKFDDIETLLKELVEIGVRHDG